MPVERSPRQHPMYAQFNKTQSAAVFASPRKQAGAFESSRQPASSFHDSSSVDSKRSKPQIHHGADAASVDRQVQLDIAKRKAKAAAQRIVNDNANTPSFELDLSKLKRKAPIFLRSSCVVINVSVFFF